MLVMVLLSRVTPPILANSLPCTVAPVPTEIDWSAMTVPAKVEPPFRVAELPTCQKTLHGLTSPSAMLLLTAVMRVPSPPILKM